MTAAEGQQGTPGAPAVWVLFQLLTRMQGSTGSKEPTKPCPCSLPLSHMEPCPPLQFYGPCRLGVCTNEQDVEFPAIRRAGRAHSKHPGMLVAWRELLLTDMLLPRGQGPCMPQHPPPPAPNSALDRPLCCRRFKWTPPSCQRPCCPLPPCRASRWGLLTWLRGQKFLLTL